MQSNLSFDKEIRIIDPVNRSFQTGKTVSMSVTILADSREHAEYIASNIQVPDGVKVTNCETVPASFSGQWVVHIHGYYIVK